jgi:hypothetical protein
MAAQLSGVPMFRDLDQMYPIDETLGLESPSHAQGQKVWIAGARTDALVLCAHREAEIIAERLAVSDLMSIVAFVPTTG